MKQQWAPAELIDHWTLTPEERQLVTTVSKTDYNQLGCAVLLKSFQLHGKFPQRKQDIPLIIVEHVAQQLRVQAGQFERYDFRKLAAKRHRGHIRRFLHVPRGTVADANAVFHWLEAQNHLLEDHNRDRLQEVVYERYKELNIEPLLPKRVDRLIGSALRSADERLYAKILSRLRPETQKKLDGLLGENVSSGSNSPLSDLKGEAGAATLVPLLCLLATVAMAQTPEPPVRSTTPPELEQPPPTQPQGQGSPPKPDPRDDLYHG